MFFLNIHSTIYTFEFKRVYVHIEFIQYHDEFFFFHRDETTLFF